MDQLIVFAVLLLALGLFAWGRIRHDLVALISLMILVLTGIVKAGEAFIGFGHAAVITVASVLVIGKALEFSGLTEWLGKGVMRIGNNPYLQVFALSALTAGASAFMNNVGALAIMMPIALHLSRKTGYSPSFILMPIAFASLLGGMTTLIGTPPNIITALMPYDLGQPITIRETTAAEALSPEAPFRFTVYVKPDVAPTSGASFDSLFVASRLAAIRATVEQMKPAHTSYQLTTTDPSLGFFTDDPDSLTNNTVL